MAYRIFSRFYSRNIRKKFAKLLTYADISINPDRFIGFILAFGLLLSLAVALNLKAFFQLPFSLVFFGVFILSQLSVYFFLAIKTDAKARFIERALPDALQLMSSNLKAGLTTERAILFASRPEFGPLAEEINEIGKKLAVGRSLQQALREFSANIRSETLEKTITLIISGLESGGSLAPLLDQTAETLREQQILKKRVSSTVLMYVIFIFVAIGIGAPTLFALSSFLIQVLIKTLSQVELPETTALDLPFTLTKISLTTNFVITFVMVFLFTNAILGSTTIGLINRGKERDGLKYIPFLLALSIGIFFLVRYILTTVFSDLFGI